MFCVGCRSHGRCFIAVFFAKFKWGSIHLWLHYFEIKKKCLWCSSPCYAECFWRCGTIKCRAPHVRPEIQVFDEPICLQVLSQAWQLPPQSNRIQQSVICNWHVMSALLSSVFFCGEYLNTCKSFQCQWFWKKKKRSVTRKKTDKLLKPNLTLKTG